MGTPADIHGRIGVLHLDRVFGSNLAEGPFHVFKMWHLNFLLFWCVLILFDGRAVIALKLMFPPIKGLMTKPAITSS
jgi:hypothetical protein